jgi:translation initiation factor IF-3
VNNKNKTRVNRDIRVPQVRVVDDDGEQVGILSTDDAIKMAQERGLDLVEVAPTAKPPVCRIIDYGKFQYEQSKKAREIKKKQHVISVKEIKITPITEAHDVQFKEKHARKFLSEGNKVKITVRFRGRQLAHSNLGLDKLKQIILDLSDVAIVEREPIMEGRNLTTTLAPKPSEKS